MIDFARVNNDTVAGYADADTVILKFEVIMSHAGVITATSGQANFQPVGGLAARDTAIASAVRALFLAQYGVALGANAVAIDQWKLV